MKTRRLFMLGVLALTAAALAWRPLASQFWPRSNQDSSGLLVGRNINMVSGTDFIGGDPYLQRQNEPSIAVSTRNPMHLFAGANDYRTVDMAGPDVELPGKPAAAPDAWLGIFKSYNGGESWTSYLLPGPPPDTVSVERGDSLKAYSTAADPVVRAGTNGMFYYSGIAFDRKNGGGHGPSVLFLARFIDNNNKEDGDPIKYIDTRIVARSNNDEFIDKPWIAVDLPQSASKSISIPIYPDGGY